MANMQYIALAVLLAVLQGAAINPPGSPKKQRPDAGHKDTQGQEQKAVAVVNNNNPDTKTETATNQPPHWYTSPERQLVIVGVLTLLAIWWQAKKTADAARSMWRSIKLQEASLQQWVNLEGWKTSIENEIPWSTEQPCLCVSYWIVNHTKMPLTLQEVKTVVNSEQIDVAGINVVPPEGRHSIESWVVLSKGEFANYLNGDLVLRISGTVTYLDALLESRKQPFDGSCRCGPSGAKFYSYGQASYSTPESREAEDKAKKAK